MGKYDVIAGANLSIQSRGAEKPSPAMAATVGETMRPKDEFDIDYPFERLVVDTEVTPDPKQVPWINPALRKVQSYKVLTGIFGKDGFVWTLDRKTEQSLWARPTTYQNISSGFDPVPVVRSKTRRFVR